MWARRADRETAFGGCYALAEIFGFRTCAPLANGDVRAQSCQAHASTLTNLLPEVGLCDCGLLVMRYVTADDVVKNRWSRIVVPSVTRGNNVVGGPNFAISLW
jgi:hypothetical protein